MTAKETEEEEEAAVAEDEDVKDNWDDEDDDVKDNWDESSDEEAEEGFFLYFYVTFSALSCIFVQCVN